MRSFKKQKGQKAYDLLKLKGLSVTAKRVLILQTFFDHEGEFLSLVQLKEALLSHLHRATLYRALRLFEAQGLLKRWPITQKKWGYALASLDPYYPLFRCKKCLQEHLLPLTLFGGSVQKEIQKVGVVDTQSRAVLEGLCRQCAKKKSYTDL